MSDTARAPLPFDPKDIRKRLQGRMPDLAIALGFPERPDRQGRIWPRNPLRNDRKSGSFVIWTTGEGAGAWKDYAVDAMHGDVFDLIGEINRLEAWIDAYWWALNWLNLDRGQVRSASQDAVDRQRAERDRLAAQARSDASAEEKSARLRAHWIGLPSFVGTVAEVYLREARGIPLERLPRMPGALRFEAHADHFDDDTGEVTTWPCLVSAMTRGRKIVALHRTWLAPDGSGKAPVARAKKMVGPVSGSAIRLTAGPSGLSPTAAAKAGRLDPLALGEGIETSATVGVARLDYRVWAAGSLSLMGLIDWPDCASAVVLLRDNDWKPEALTAFDRVAARWRAMSKGRPVLIAASPEGSDFNDFVRAA